MTNLNTRLFLFFDVYVLLLTLPASSPMIHAAIPSFRSLREALRDAKPSSGFPFGEGLTAERLKALREAPHFQEYLREVRAEAQRAHTEPIPALPYSLWRLYETAGSRIEYERPYFARRGRLPGLVLVSVIDATDEHLALIQDSIWAICDEVTWCVPAHAQDNRLPIEERVDLFAAETAHALAETLTLLGGRLEKAVNERTRREIERRIFKPLFNDAVHFHWESTPTNWSAVCAGAVGMAALLLETNRERLAGMMDRCCSAMECFLEGFGADGGCAEGVGYWQYGFGYYVYFAEMLHEFTRGKIDLLSGEKIRNIANFPAGMSLSGGNFVNFSDGVMRMEIATGLISRLSARLGVAVPESPRVPSFHFDHCYRWPHVTRNLFWTNPALLGKLTPPGTFVFDDLGWVLDRRTLNGVPIGFSARGGHNAEPHNQNDLGHFILHAGGDSLLVDLGAGVYTRDYFGPNRYNLIHNGSEGHSVPLIDGQPQKAGRQFEAKILARETRADGIDFKLDLTKAYAVPNLKRLERTFRWTHSAAKASLELTDSFDFNSAPRELQEVFISLVQPTLERGKITWRGARGAVAMTFDPAQFTAACEAIPSHTHGHEPIVVQRVRLTTSQPSTQVIGKFTFEMLA